MTCNRWLVCFDPYFVSQICTCINCFYSKGSNFTLNICLINFYSSSKNLNGNLGFAVAVNLLLSIKRFFFNKRNLYLSRER